MSKVETIDRRGDPYEEHERSEQALRQRSQTPEQRRQEREERENLEFLRHLDNLDIERAADRVEELSAGWVDELTGYPLPGFRSPRYRTPDELAYRAWYHGSSSEAARVRRIREGE